MANPQSESSALGYRRGKITALENPKKDQKKR
jgi:hypothetical protein